MAVFVANLRGQGGDGQKDASQIVQKVAEVYAGLNRFRFELHYEIRSEGSGGIPPMEYWRTESFVGPDHWRYDVGPAEGMVTTSRLSDGTSKWVLRQPPGEYTEEPSTGVEGGFINSLRAIASDSLDIRLAGSESLTIADHHAYDCYVITVSQRPKVSPSATTRARTYWIDKVGLLVLKRLEESTNNEHIRTIESVDIERFDLNPIFPPLFFALRPSVSARKVSQFSSLEQGLATASVGEKAPSFRLKDLTGQERDSTQFKGRFLVLVFWGSWCGPCREEMPLMDLLHRAFKDRRLSVLGISSRESPDTSREYLAAHNIDVVSCPDLKGVVAASFGVKSWPSTFLIGPNGTILYSSTGASIGGLQDALAKVGIWSHP